MNKGLIFKVIRSFTNFIAYKSTINKCELFHQNNQLVQYGFMINQQAKMMMSQFMKSTIFIESTQVENAPEWSLKSKQQIMSLFDSLGINLNKNIFICNGKSDSLFLYPSCRGAILLLEAGAKKVCIIEQTNNKIVQKDVQKLNIITIQKRSLQNRTFGGQILVTKQLIKDIINTKQYVIIDTRSKSQYQGTNSGYNYFHRKGKIPSSIFPWPYFKNYSPQEIHMLYTNGSFIKLWDQNLLDQNKKKILYCGNGWRASQAWVYLQVYGIKNVYVYSNGWMQWSKQMEV